MTEQELLDKIALLEQKSNLVDAQSAKIAELESRIYPPREDPNENKPSSWNNFRSEFDEKIDKKAQEIALKTLQEAEKKKEELKFEELKLQEEWNKKADETFNRLVTEGIIKESKEQNDEGWKQRKQVLGLLYKTGGLNVEEAARNLKTAWDNGLEYDVDKNAYKKIGSTNSNREAFIGSSANNVAPLASKGVFNARAARGSLDLAEKLFLEMNKK